MGSTSFALVSLLKGCDTGVMAGAGAATLGPVLAAVC